MGSKAKWKPLELPFARKTENPKQITFLGGLLTSAAIKDLQDAGGMVASIISPFPEAFWLVQWMVA